MKTNEIYNTMDIIDTRDIVSRLEELQEWLDTYQKDVEAAETPEEKEQAQEALDDFCADYEEELKQLKALHNEWKDQIPDWEHGEALIHEDFFTEYCEEMCKDIGYVSSDVPWFIVIDWEKTAEHIKIDYTEIDFDGQTYYIRA